MRLVGEIDDELDEVDGDEVNVRLERLISGNKLDEYCEVRQADELDKISKVRESILQRKRD